MKKSLMRKLLLFNNEEKWVIITKMCRKNNFLLILLLFAYSMFFFSCSSEAVLDLSSGSEETLKASVKKRAEDVLWTRECEGIKLTRKISNMTDVSSKLNLNPMIVLLSDVENVPIYPAIEGFSSLDTTLFTSEVKNTVEKFSQNVISWVFDESLICENSIFTLILFKYDVETLWKENFLQDFPSDDEKKLFTNVYYGEPFIDENSVCTPIRFMNSKGFMDVQIIMDKTESFKICQIIIKKWGK